MKKVPLTITVNGLVHEVYVPPNRTLLDLVRDDLDLTGSKRGCDTGDCGACTVLLDGEAVLSCLTLALAVGDRPVTTIEGLARGDMLHPLQEAFVTYGGSQCGICTPGMIIAGVGFLNACVARAAMPTREDCNWALAGNICRCTGYVKIIDAMMAAAEVMLREAGATRQPTAEAPA